MLNTIHSPQQDMKLCDKLMNKHGEGLDDKSLTICSGTDYININYQHIICPDAATAKVKSTQIPNSSFITHKQAM